MSCNPAWGAKSASRGNAWGNESRRIPGGSLAQIRARNQERGCTPARSNSRVLTILSVLAMVTHVRDARSVRLDLDAGYADNSLGVFGTGGL